jgi:hypothetical protein
MLCGGAQVTYGGQDSHLKLLSTDVDVDYLTVTHLAVSAVRTCNTHFVNIFQEHNILLFTIATMLRNTSLNLSIHPSNSNLISFDGRLSTKAPIFPDAVGPGNHHSIL